MGKQNGSEEDGPPPHRLNGALNGQVAPALRALPMVLIFDALDGLEEDLLALEDAAIGRLAARSDREHQPRWQAALDAVERARVAVKSAMKALPKG